MNDDNHATPKFAAGDRVRIAEDWFQTPLRGRKGTVAEGRGLPMQPGSMWVELDGHATESGEIEAAELPPDALTRI